MADTYQKVECVPVRVTLLESLGISRYCFGKWRSPEGSKKNLEILTYLHPPTLPTYLTKVP